MRVDDIREKVSSCTDNFDEAFLKEIENDVLDGKISLEELYAVKAEILAMKDDYISIRDGIKKEREVSITEYHELSNRLKRLDSYEEDKTDIARKLVMPSFVTNIGVILSGLTVKAGFSESFKAFLSTSLITVIADIIIYNKRRSKINSELEEFGDLDELLMKRYDVLERDKGLYDLSVRIEDKARCASSNEIMIKELIGGLDNDEEIVKEYVK